MGLATWVSPSRQVTRLRLLRPSLRDLAEAFFIRQQRHWSHGSTPAKLDVRWDCSASERASDFSLARSTPVGVRKSHTTGARLCWNSASLESSVRYFSRCSRMNTAP